MRVKTQYHNSTESQPKTLQSVGFRCITAHQLGSDRA